MLDGPYGEQSPRNCGPAGLGADPLDWTRVGADDVTADLLHRALEIEATEPADSGE
jgi:hypothetical protein